MNNRNSKGFTLIEVLVAMLILILGLAGSLTAVISVLNHNYGNALRDEAVKIAQEQMENVRNIPYDDPSLIPGAVNSTVLRQFRNNPGFQYQVTRTVQTDIADAYVKLITVTVQWPLQGRSPSPSYTFQTILRRPI